MHAGGEGLAMLAQVATAMDATDQQGVVQNAAAGGQTVGAADAVATVVAPEAAAPLAAPEAAEFEPAPAVGSALEPTFQHVAPAAEPVLIGVDTAHGIGHQTHSPSPRSPRSRAAGWLRRSRL